MDDLDIPQPSAAVKASFAPIMKTLDAVRAQLSGVQDVIAVRPGYKYPPDAKPVPAVVVAVRPGTVPAQAAELEAKFSAG